MEPHVVKSYMNQMGRISASLEEMGARVEEAIGIAGRALTQRDAQLRQQAKANDKQINTLQDSIDAQIADMFSKQSPMASELRLILSVHKIANALERMGDLAKNTTKRLVRSDIVFTPETYAKVQQLVEVSSAMLKDALVAFREQDEKIARAVWKRDDEADTLCREVFSLLIADICAVPGKEKGMVDALFAVKQFERIADYACAIAKTVIYITTGQRPHKDMLEE